MELDDGDSDVEFHSDEEDQSFVAPTEASAPRGDALRNLRKQIDFTMTFGTSTLYEGSNLNQPKEPELPEVNGQLLSIDEGWIFATRRLMQIGFERSKSQRQTKGLNILQKLFEQENIFFLNLNIFFQVTVIAFCMDCWTN